MRDIGRRIKILLGTAASIFREEKLYLCVVPEDFSGFRNNQRSEININHCCHF
jgi:hypothetical protein